MLIGCRNEALELKLRLMNIQGGTPKRTSTPHPGGPDPSSDEALDPSSSISTNNSSININVNIGTSTYATTLHHTTPSYGYSESISAPIPSGSTSPRRVTRPLPRSRLSIGPSTVSNTKVSSTKKTAHKKAGVHAASLPMSMTTPLGFPMDLGSTKKARLVGAAQSEQNGRNGQTEVDKTTLANRVSNSNLNANAKVFSLRGALDDGAAAARRKTIDGEAFYEAVSSGSGASRHVSGQGHVPRKKSVSHMRSVSVGVMDE
ncbi:hypothetical protein DFP72DRAFT_196159 [Ephemerocybe angulata]|uniref:Uncharacterized protein n=1 Tax=Ephemerocybe angulata TaxID=980116 RepID=A0A8H6HAH6_9AGAR|nr:hypothetical protein DFP72DRAFT_196159 [Tulosesus angulatus]